MQFEKTNHTKLNRRPDRGSFDKETIYKIIDEAFYCHVSFIQNGKPFVIPTIHARMEDKIILHGAKASRMLKHISAGNEVCIAITLMDGLVLARSVFHHSMNYRSVVLFGSGEEVKDENLKFNTFHTLANHIMPGRWEDARRPNKKEMDATVVVSININDASAKIRTGPPVDDADDYDLPVWAGEMPFLEGFNLPINDPKLNPGIPVPEYLKK
jgi:uncharacterized protein